MAEHHDVKQARIALVKAAHAHRRAVARSHRAREAVKRAGELELQAALSERFAHDILAQAMREVALPWRPIHEANDWGFWYLEFDEGHGTANSRRAIVPRFDTFQLRPTYDGEIVQVRWLETMATENINDHGHTSIVRSTRTMMLGDGPRPVPIVGWVLPDEWKPRTRGDG